MRTLIVMLMLICISGSVKGEKMTEFSWQHFREIPKKGTFVLPSRRLPLFRFRRSTHDSIRRSPQVMPMPRFRASDRVAKTSD